MPLPSNKPVAKVVPASAQASQASRAAFASEIAGGEYVVVIKFDFVSAVLLSAVIIFATLALCTRR